MPLSWRWAPAYLGPPANASSGVPWSKELLPPSLPPAGGAASPFRDSNGPVWEKGAPSQANWAEKPAPHALAYYQSCFPDLAHCCFPSKVRTINEGKEPLPTMLSLCFLTASLASKVTCELPLELHKRREDSFPFKAEKPNSLTQWALAVAWSARQPLCWKDGLCFPVTQEGGTSPGLGNQRAFLWCF